MQPCREKKKKRHVLTRSVQPFRPNVETPPYKHTFLHVPCKPPVESRNALLYIYVPTRSVRSPRIPPLNHENAPMRPYSPYAPSTRKTKNLQPHNHTSGFVDGPSSPSPSLWIYSYAEKEKQRDAYTPCLHPCHLGHLSSNGDL